MSVYFYSLYLVSSFPACSTEERRGISVCSPLVTVPYCKSPAKLALNTVSVLREIHSRT